MTGSRRHAETVLGGRRRGKRPRSPEDDKDDRNDTDDDGDKEMNMVTTHSERLCEGWKQSSQDGDKCIFQFEGH